MTPISDEQLREAYARALEERGRTHRGDCPSPEAMLALARREGRESDRLTTLDHVMSCGHCQQEFELLRALARAGGEEGRRAVEQIRWRRYASVALAASVLLAVGVGVEQRFGRDGADVLRGDADDIALAAPAAEAAVAASSPVVLAWHPLEGATRYSIELLSTDGTLAFSGQTADTTLIVAAPPVAGEYRWLVRAQAGDGTERRSAARALRVREE
jgi:hypothetical protein